MIGTHESCSFCGGQETIRTEEEFEVLEPLKVCKTNDQGLPTRPLLLKFPH